MIRVRWPSGRVTEYPDANFAQQHEDTELVLLVSEDKTPIALIGCFETMEIGEPKANHFQPKNGDA